MPKEIRELPTIAYSQLTDTVQVIKTKKNITQNFIQVMLLWFHEGNVLMEVGEKFERELKVNGKVYWKFTIERKK